jgi:hypothetical protein
MDSWREELISILEALLEGHMDSAKAYEEIYALQWSSFENVFANLHHYLDDEDIRAKDTEYKLFQDSEMKKLIQHLRSGNVELANEVSFLHESQAI